MQSELDVIDSLNALDYKETDLEEVKLSDAINEGLSNKVLKQIISWLAAELHVLRKTDECVSVDVNDVEEFAMELSALLKELGCPYKKLITGPLESRFTKKDDILLLLEYLMAELMGARMFKYFGPQQQNLVIAKTTTKTAFALEQLAKDLAIPKPPANITTKAFFDKINFKVEEKLRSVKSGVLSEPMLLPENKFTDEQWQKLEVMCIDLENEYNLRRQMLLTRLEVTVQSFNWSERLKSEQQHINASFAEQMQELKTFCQGGRDTDISALLAARKDLAIIEKTSSANVRKNTACKIQKHMIGSVPDRGGRANEHAPPPPEMPAWQQQRASGPAGGGRGGGRGGFGGNRGNRGGGNNWNSQPQRQQHQQPYQNTPKPQFQAQQHHQPQQYNDQYTQNLISGSGRVQGSGWTQSGYQDRNNDNEYRRGGGRPYNRGQSNNRGGRR